MNDVYSQIKTPLKTSELFKQFKCFSIGHLEHLACLRCCPQSKFCTCTDVLYKSLHHLLDAEEGKTRVLPCSKKQNKLQQTVKKPCYVQENHLCVQQTGFESCSMASVWFQVLPCNLALTDRWIFINY